MEHESLWSMILLHYSQAYQCMCVQRTSPCICQCSIKVVKRIHLHFFSINKYFSIRKVLWIMDLFEDDYHNLTERLDDWSLEQYNLKIQREKEANDLWAKYECEAAESEQITSAILLCGSVLIIGELLHYFLYITNYYECGRKRSRRQSVRTVTYDAGK